MIIDHLMEVESNYKRYFDEESGIMYTGLKKVGDNYYYFYSKMSQEVLPLGSFFLFHKHKKPNLKDKKSRHNFY